MRANGPAARRPRLALLLLTSLAHLACPLPPPAALPASEAAVQLAVPRALVDVAKSSREWPAVSKSPWPEQKGTRADPRAGALARSCGEPDGALTHVAEELLGAHGLGVPSDAEVTRRLRASGEPDVSPRVITATGRAPLATASVEAELSAHAARGGKRRCGIAIATVPGGAEKLVALRVDALADLSPLPTRARTGQWLSFEARLHVDASSAHLVILGPHGPPRSVPTSLDRATGVSRARVALDQPGAFTMQLVGDLRDGPRPLLEARVFADVVPSLSEDESPAPGESEGATSSDLAGMVAALRAFERLPNLAASSALGALATAHAEQMREKRAVAHDLGNGDFRERLEAMGGFDVRAVGENVAHAPTVALAHRALHASPSHRANLLRADYTHMGVAVAVATDGSVYVCETFVAARHAPLQTTF